MCKIKTISRQKAGIGLKIQSLDFVQKTQSAVGSQQLAVLSRKSAAVLSWQYSVFSWQFSIDSSHTVERGYALFTG
jgi:hypothetical protein